SGVRQSQKEGCNAVARGWRNPQGIAAGESSVKEKLALRDDRLQLAQQHKTEIAARLDGMPRQDLGDAALPGMGEVATPDVVCPSLLHAAEARGHERGQGADSHL